MNKSITNECSRVSTRVISDTCKAPNIQEEWMIWLMCPKFMAKSYHLFLTGCFWRILFLEVAWLKIRLTTAV